MFKLWMCLSVLYVLLCRVSGDQAVSLDCPRNVTVRRGDQVKPNCFVIWKNKCSDWEHPCSILNNGSEIHSWSCYDETHVSPEIMDKVMKEESVTVTLQTDCGMDGSTIEVQVTEIPTEQIPIQSNVDQHMDPEAKPHMSYIVVGVFVVTVVGMLAFLFKTNRMTKINKHFRDVFKGYSSRQQPLTSEDHRPSII